MCLYAHDNFQVNKHYRKGSSRTVFSLLNIIPFFEAIIMNANIALAASFPCVFATRSTFLLCRKGTAKMINSINTNFIFDPAFGW